MRRIRLFVLAVLLLVVAPGARAQQVEVYWVGPTVIDVSESAGTVVLQAALNGTSFGNQFVVYEVLPGGTATPQVDFSGGNGMLHWSPGDVSPQNVVLTIVDDTEVEATETIFIAFTSADGPLISPTAGVIQVNILDDDGEQDLPHITMTVGSTGDGSINPQFCYDGSGQAYVCGTEYVITYPYDGGTLSLDTSDGLAVTDTVRFDLVTWGGVEAFPASVELRPGSRGVPVFINRVGDSSLQAGGVRMANLHNVAPAGPGDFHAARIVIEKPEPYDVNDCFLCVLFIYAFSDEDIPCFGDCALTVGCGGPLARSTATRRDGPDDLDLLRRYRDEVLITTAEGQAIVDLYGRMGMELIGSFLTNPGLVGDFMTARNDWLPALTDLLDGDGAMNVTPSMQASLTSLLDAVAAATAGQLAGQIAELRAAAGLDALTGMSIAQAHQLFVAGGATPNEATSWGEFKAKFH